MAQYICTARSNYFKVKDVAAFKADIGQYSVEIHDGKEQNQVCILNDDSDGAGWPSFVFNETTQDHDEIDFFAEVAKHLQEDEVAIFNEAGAEKMRYVIGYSVAINNKGDRVNISLQDIYKKARKLTKRPKDITTAEY